MISISVNVSVSVNVSLGLPSAISSTDPLAIAQALDYERWQRGIETLRKPGPRIGSRTVEREPCDALVREANK